MLPLIRFYKRWVSPLLPPRCRFYPTCSEYAITAISEYGSWRGSLMAIKRLSRCHPFHAGGYDPVPCKNVSPDAQSIEAEHIDKTNPDVNSAGKEKS